VTKYGRVEYRDSQGELHRDDGPAEEFTNGAKIWWRHGIRHRVDGPAVEDPVNNSYSWYVDGKRHRLGGPAMEWMSGIREWYLGGVRYLEDEYWYALWEGYTVTAVLWLSFYEVFSEDGGL